MEYLTYLYLLGIYTRQKDGVYTKKIPVTYGLFPRGLRLRSAMLSVMIRGVKMDFGLP